MGAKKPIMVRKSSLENNKKVVKKKKEKTSVNSSEIINYIIIGVLFVFFIFLISNTKTLNNKIDKLNDKLEDNRITINQLKRENSDLNKFYSENSKKLAFIDKHVVFRIEGFGNYYYSYECMLKKAGGNHITFWAYNTEQARDYGIREGSC